MNCQDVRQLLGPFVDDELPVELVARINRHLVDCLECQDEQTSLTIVCSRLRDDRHQFDPPQGFMERLKENVEARQRASKRIPRFSTPLYMVPIAAAAAALVFCVLPRSEPQRSVGTATSMLHSIPLTAQSLYSNEHDIRKSQLHPVEYASASAAQLTGCAVEPPRFDGWNLNRTCVVSVNTTKAIKYSYRQIDHGKIKTIECYQFRGGMFDASELNHHVIDGRPICCGTKGNVSLVYWRDKNKDFVLASELPREDLLSIALDS